MSVFLSYRRDDSVYALWIYPWLIQWFGQDNVFWDRKNIDPGATFTTVIENQIRSSRAFVALVSHNWLGSRDDQGNRRIDSPEDWIHRETSLALQQKMLLIPVLVGGMKAPSKADLPVELQPFAALNMLALQEIAFHDRLRETLETVVASAEPGASGVGYKLQRRAGNLLRRQMRRLQVRAAELIKENKLDRAHDELHEGFEVLGLLLELIPGDTAPALDAQLGYLFGTTGQALRRAGMREQADQYTDLAMSVFERVKSSPVALYDPAEVSAINGIGGVYLERGDPRTALDYYRKATSLDPSYSYAWHDLFLALHELAKRNEIYLAGMREAIDKARQTGAGMPGLAADTFAFMERAYGHWVQHDAELRERRRRAALRVLPASVVLVITESRPLKAILNIDLSFRNPRDTATSVHDMTLEVTQPDGSVLHFSWTLFYDISPGPLQGAIVHTKSESSASIHIDAGAERTLGVQFAGPAVDASQLWRAGVYQIALAGRAQHEGGAEPSEVATRFRIGISPVESTQVDYWIHASSVDWDRLRDPDRACGVAVPIDQASIAAGVQKAAHPLP